jgi:hypothetical protein
MRREAHSESHYGLAFLSLTQGLVMAKKAKKAKGKKK